MEICILTFNKNYHFTVETQALIGFSKDQTKNFPGEILRTMTSLPQAVVVVAEVWEALRKSPPAAGTWHSWPLQEELQLGPDLLQ